MPRCLLDVDNSPTPKKNPRKQLKTQQKHPNNPPHMLFSPVYSTLRASSYCLEFGGITVLVMQSEQPHRLMDASDPYFCKNGATCCATARRVFSMQTESKAVSPTQDLKNKDMIFLELTMFSSDFLNVTV